MLSDLDLVRRLVRIGGAAEVLDVSISTLRRWEVSGRLVADRVGAHRHYDLAKLRPEHFQVSRNVERRTVAHARVSSHDRKADLELQRQVLELHCAEQGWTCQVIADLGSGMNTDKRGLKRLLGGIAAGEVGSLVITYEDRPLRFGAELVFAICAARRVEVVIATGARTQPSRTTLPRAFGACTFQEIADALNARGITAHRGGIWTPMQVWRLLRQAAEGEPLSRR